MGSRGGDADIVTVLLENGADVNGCVRNALFCILYIVWWCNVCCCFAVVRFLKDIRVCVRRVDGAVLTVYACYSIGTLMSIYEMYGCCLLFVR